MKPTPSASPAATLEAQVCGRVLVELRPRLAWDDLVDGLIDPEEGLCAHRPRFGEPQVIERVTALGAGRLTVAAIGPHRRLPRVRRRRPPRRPHRPTLPEYSTRDHLLLEGWVLDHLEQLTATPVTGLDPTVVEAAITGEAPRLGVDQAAAIRELCASGPVIRSLIVPAGFGKTTTVHAAAMAANRAGQLLVGLAATNQAAGELRHAGIPAPTIARFALDGAALPLGAVVVLDEVSQVATADAEMPSPPWQPRPGARLWCLGDPHQAQAVRAGGLGAELTRLRQDGRIPAPELTENRRQLQPAERQALAEYRAGHLAASQAIAPGTAGNMTSAPPTPPAKPSPTPSPPT